ncbi:MAG: hypothetical protein KDD51_16295 [Bdellovibrionales bacterium]|nr:hypothetical protein [Bdellovibrionales bacterium]MCB0416520.1 hypothetical protein [Bdellovibrionales bacterium]
MRTCAKLWLLVLVVCFSGKLFASVCGLLVASFEAREVALAIAHLGKTSKDGAIQLSAAPDSTFPFRSTLKLYRLPGDPVAGALVRQAMQFHDSLLARTFPYPVPPPPSFTPHQIAESQRNRPGSTLAGVRSQWEMLNRSGQLQSATIEAAEIQFLENGAMGCAVGSFVCYAIGLNTHNTTLVRLGGRLLRETVQRGWRAQQAANPQRAMARYLEDMRRDMAQRRNIATQEADLEIAIIVDNETDTVRLADYLQRHTDFERE